MTESDPLPDPIDAVVRSDHAAILGALATLRANTDSAVTGELFGALSADIVRHFVAEEQYLLPAVRERVEGGAAISDASFAEHERIEKLLKKLDDDDTTDEHITASLGSLQTALQEHISEQEQHLVPALIAVADQAELNELGEGMLGAEQLAPTHPRAIVFKSATLSKVTSWVAGLVEKSLDSR